MFFKISNENKGEKKICMLMDDFKIKLFYKTIKIPIQSKANHDHMNDFFKRLCLLKIDK
jgi:hypothetical protein